MPIKAVIFDLDGTLYDSIEDIADANNMMLRQYGFPEHKLEDYVGWIGNGAAKLVNASLPKDVFEGGIDLQKYLDTYSGLYESHIAVKSHLYENIDVVLNYLVENNIPFAINTNKPQRLTDAAFAAYLKDWSFVEVIGQNERFEKKPSPEAALTIAQKMREKPEDILFVGDSYVDIRTAYAAGMQHLGVSWGYGTLEDMKEAGATTIVDKALEIKDFIETINKP